MSAAAAAALPPPNPHLRAKVVAIYKQLLYLGREYPQGGLAYVRPRLHRAFMANAHLRDDEAIRKGIERADFVRRGSFPLFSPSIFFFFLFSCFVLVSSGSIVWLDVVCLVSRSSQSALFSAQCLLAWCCSLLACLMCSFHL